jgi:hypothetical protein
MVHCPFQSGQGWLKPRWLGRERTTFKPNDSMESSSADLSFVQMNRCPVQHSPQDLHKVFACDSMPDIISHPGRVYNLNGRSPNASMTILGVYGDNL